MRRPHALLAISLTLLGLLVGACSTPTTNTTSATGTPCPNAVQQLVDRQVTPDLEISLVVDGSGSFMGDRSASRAFVAQQVALTVDDAVDKGCRASGDRFRWIGRQCPHRRRVPGDGRALPKRSRSGGEACLPQAGGTRSGLAGRVVNGRPPMARPGTSVVGGYVALADAAPLTVGRREALMLSDGIALPEMAVAVDLSRLQQHWNVRGWADRAAAQHA